MGTATAVQQATDLLVGRLAEARSRRDELTAEMTALTDEIESIAGAVQRLTGSLADAHINLGAEGVPSPAAKPASIRATVKAVLESEDKPFSTAEIRKLIPAKVADGKTDEQVANGVRAALWSLRQKGDALGVADGQTVSTKWHGYIAAGPQNVPADVDGEQTLPGAGDDA